LAVVIALTIPARAADIYACYNGSAQQGGHRLTVNGTQTKQYAQQSFPVSTVTVFNHSTQTPATIFQDGAGTQPLINPFTSSSTGVAFWCAADGQYDVKYSGTTITAPFTVSNIRLSLSGGGGGGGGTVGPGTVGHLLKFTSSTTAGNSNCTDDGVSPVACSLGVSVQSTALFATKVNNPSTGTTVNLLLARDSSGRAINAQPTDTNNLIGIAGFNAGLAGSVTYAYSGSFPCIFDNQTQINDWAVLGSTSQCHDAGATEPQGVQNMGRITSVNAGAGTTATIDMGLPDVNPSVNGGVGNCANAAGPIAYYTLALVIGCDPSAVTDGFGNFSMVSLALSGSGSGFTAYGQGVAPASLAANSAYLSGPASVVTSFNTTLPATPGTSGQFLQIDTVPDGTHLTTKWASAAGCPEGTCIVNAPTGDQVLLNGWNLTNDLGGGFIAEDTSGTPSDATLTMFMNGSGQGNLQYDEPAGSISTNIRFNPTTGAIVLNPKSGGADDAAHGVVIGNSALTIAGGYTDGNSLVLGAGNALIQGGSLATGNPLLTLGSTGVEGVIKTVPSSGGGSYLFRFPATASNRSITAIDKSGNLVLSAGTLGNSLGLCTDINGLATTSGCTSGGTVTSVGLTINSTSPSGIFTVTGSPVTTTGTHNINLSGTSGGVPYFSSSTVMSSSGVLAANGVVLGGGAGAAPTVAGADSTTTHAFFATAGAPAFRAIVSGDIPTLNQNTSGTASNLSGTPTLPNGTAAATQSVDDNSTKLATTAYVDRMKARGISFSIGDPGGIALASGSTTTAYVTVPFACTISAYNLLIDAGTVTVKFWKIATGTAIPTSGNSINTSGVGISSGTAIHSTTLSDFTTTTVTANDIMAMNVTVVATAKFLNGVLECDQ
jgi:hypothetical protein